MANIKKVTLKNGKTRYRLRYRTPEGKAKTETFDLERDASRRARDVEHRKDTGTFLDPHGRKITVGKLGTELLGTKNDPRNYDWYERMLRLHVYPRWETVPVVAISHLDVTTWVTSLCVDRGPDTVRGAFRSLHEVVKLALNSRLIGFDPCLGVKGLPPVDRREMLFLTGSQVETLANAMEEAFPGYGWGLMVRFAAYSGLRAGEIGGLRVKHLDLLGRRVNVVKARKRTGTDGKPKKGKLRWVDIPRQLCDELAAFLATREVGPESRVWTGERGGALNHHWFYDHRYKPVVDKLSRSGLLPVHEYADEEGEAVVLTLRFHDLRHTCVALLIDKGMQVYEVSAHLGHTNIQTTINTYGHMFPSVRDRIRESLELTLDEARGVAPVTNLDDARKGSEGAP